MVSIKSLVINRFLFILFYYKKIPLCKEYQSEWQVPLGESSSKIIYQIRKKILVMLNDFRKKSKTKAGKTMRTLFPHKYILHTKSLICFHWLPRPILPITGLGALLQCGLSPTLLQFNHWLRQGTELKKVKNKITCKWYFKGEVLALNSTRF